MAEETPEAAEPQAEPTPVLGVDPEEAVAPAPAPEPAAQPAAQEPPADPNQTVVPARHYESVLEKASLYDSILGDPQARALLEQHFGTSGYQAPQEAQTPATPNGEDVPAWAQQGMTEIEQLRATMQQMQQRLGNQDLTLFKYQNPDYGTYESEIVSLLNDAPQLGLQRAYDIAKKVAGVSAAPNGPSVPASPAVGPAEGRGAGLPPQLTEDEIFARAEQRLMDRKVVPNTSSAIKEAYELAKKMHGER